MPLVDSYPWSVVFVVAPRTVETGLVRNVPIGTGFLVSCPAEFSEDLLHQYVVTASHVVIDGSPTKVRLKTDDHSFVDVDVPQWIHHHEADVAIAPLRIPPTPRAQRLITVSVEVGTFLRADWRILGSSGTWDLELGERVYFIGLFDRFGSMGDRNIPMTRSGTLGALNVPNVPIGPPENRRYVEAHLIDCRSYAGFSGSPCFVQRDMFRRSTFLDDGYPVDDESGRVGTDTALLGIVSGHFDMWDTARLVGDLPLEAGSVEVPQNIGVGVVTPAKAIKELMDMPELSDDRKRVEREAAAREAADEGATLDSAESEFERFENLTRKLVHTPKEPSEKRKKRES